MGQEIEQYLLERYGKGVERLRKGNLRTKLEALTELVEQKLPAAPTTSLKLRENLYYLNNVLTECQRASSKPFFPSRSFTKIKDSLTRMKEELGQLNGNGPSPNGNGNSNPNGPPIFSEKGDVSIDLAMVKGFDSEVLSMMKLLLRQDRPGKFNAVGVAGKTGTGKSTLCRLLLTSDEVKKHFFPRILISLSEIPAGDESPEIAIVKRMLDSLGVEQDNVESVSWNDGLSGLIRALHAELMGKKYLIMLDDATKPGDWYEQLDFAVPPDSNWENKLAYGLPKGCGGTVVVTSRNESLLKKMIGEENTHHLLPRSDSDTCWNIFRDAVQQQLSTSSEVELKKEVTQKCGGLPLAAKMMGEIMNAQIEAEQITSNGRVEDVPNPSSLTQLNPEIASPIV